MQIASDYPTKSLEGLKRGRGEVKCSAGDMERIEVRSTSRGGRSRGPRLTVSVLPE